MWNLDFDPSEGNVTLTVHSINPNKPSQKPKKQFEIGKTKECFRHHFICEIPVPK